MNINLDVEYEFKYVPGESKYDIVGEAIPGRFGFHSFGISSYIVTAHKIRIAGGERQFRILAKMINATVENLVARIIDHEVLHLAIIDSYLPSDSYGPNYVEKLVRELSDTDDFDIYYNMFMFNPETGWEPESPKEKIRKCYGITISGDFDLVRS